MKKGPEIIFDAVAHRYTVDGEEYPGVTGVLKDLGVIDTQWYNGAGAERGSSVHEAIHMMHEGILDVSAYADSEILPYLNAWNQCCQDLNLAVTGSEVLVADQTFRFATHIDIIGNTGGKEIVADIKTGSLQPWHGIQLAAATALVGVRRRMVIELKKTGAYTVHTEYKGERFTERTWDQTWLSAITLYHWEREHAK